jgi:uncharacterized protein (DUF302 family)
MSARGIAVASAVLFVFLLLLASSASTRADDDDGIVRVKSAHPMAETIARLKQDVAGKGIIFFAEIDQAEVAANVGIKLPASTLLIFGGPRLGALFLAANPESGLDWPVRLLVHQDEKGNVWAVYQDFAWIARRYRIKDLDGAFATASKVIASIAASVQSK